MANAQGWVSQEAQMGFTADEHGTDLPTNKKITNGMITVTPVSSSKEVRSQGDLAPNLVVPLKETSEWQLSDGVPCYNNLYYFLAMVLGVPTSTPLGGGAFQHEFSLSKSATTALTGAIAFGDGDDAIKTLHAVASGFSTAWNIQNETSDFAVSGFARDVQLDAELSDEVDAVEVSPIMPEHVEIGVGGTVADALASNSIRDNVYGVEIEVGDRFAAFATFRRGLRSFNHVITTLPSLTFSLSQLNDPDSRNWINKYREAKRSYVAVVAEGKEIVAGTPAAGDNPAVSAVKESYSAVFCVAPTEVSTIGEDEDAKTVVTPARVIVDPSGFMLKITLVNRVAPVS